MGNVLVSVPHYFAHGLNEVVGSGITSAVRGLLNMLLLILTGFEKTISFAIEYYVGTISCLVVALVHGTLAFSEYAINETVGFINTAMQDSLERLEAAVQDVRSAIDTVSKDLSYLGIDFPSVSGIETNVLGLSSVTQINATEIVSDIEALNNDVPSFEQLKEIVQEVISIPFALIKNMLK